MNSSADLVARACQGEQEAFRLIFERYSRPIISFIYDLVGDRELAEDLMQEALDEMRRHDQLALERWALGHVIEFHRSRGAEDAALRYEERLAELTPSTAPMA